MDTFLDKGGEFSDQLSIWRKFHVERDILKPPTIMTPGVDFAEGKILSARFAGREGNNEIWDVTTDVTSVQQGEFSLGTFRWNNLNFSNIRASLSTQHDFKLLGSTATPQGVRVQLQDAPVWDSTPDILVIFDSTIGVTNEYKVIDTVGQDLLIQTPNNLALPEPANSAVFVRFAQTLFRISTPRNQFRPAVNDAVEVFQNEFLVQGNQRPTKMKLGARIHSFYLP